MNILKLRGKMVEKQINVDQLAKSINVNSATMYRKIKKGDGITIGEAARIKQVLDLTDAEAYEIFLAN